MSILVFSVLFFPVVISGLAVFLVKPNIKYLKLLTAFSGAYLLGISFLEIVPEIFGGGETFTIGLFVILGFFIQLLLDFITKGVEHGHEHLHEKNIVHNSSYLNTLPIMVGICIHSFLEGMPLAENYGNTELQHTMLTGIAIHNIPISIVLISLLLHNSKKGALVPVTLLLIFAFSAPLGTVVCNLIGTTLIEEYAHFFDYVLAMVVGIFLHISTTILFESDDHHRFDVVKLLVIVLGFATTIVLSMAIH
ncbi:MAG TPA: ZIP family metal transporter [Bacteroidales bacterium]|nr:ZIP family metal transporter [Bacteroidales bacterium]HPI30359.1 ZIP family metal transporter [Bacteroidales bacterium]HQN15966.1 ZIP family metal transporter [Bacteroidales bacterium]HQP15594.1 ZIP family metal transporter [Bacteroidales bacterium]